MIISRSSLILAEAYLEYESILTVEGINLYQPVFFRAEVL